MTEYYQSSDMADLMSAAGLRMRTAHAIRQAVQQGRLNPSGKTRRGTYVWDGPAARLDVWRVHLREQRRLYGTVAELAGEQMMLRGE